MQEMFDVFLKEVGSILPGVFGALLVLVIGWIVAVLIRKFVSRLLKSIKFDERLNKSNKGESKLRLEKTISKIVYFIILIYVLLIVLNMMGVTNILKPLETMVEDFIGFFPNIVAAVIIGFAGYVIASIASEAVGAVTGVLDNFSAKFDVFKELKLSKIVKQLVFLFVFVPILIVALQALKMEVISQPATQMLNELMSAIPKIIAAGLIITVFYVGGKYVSAILKKLIQNLGGDELPAKLKLTAIISEKHSLSAIVANIVFFFIIFSGIISALEKLEMVKIADTLNNLFVMSGQIFFGLLIMAIGNLVGNFAHKALVESNAKGFASIAKISVLGLFLAIALSTMGIADDIVNLAFGLVLGAVAVAVALSFGLGGREAAGKQMEHILKKFRKDTEDKS